MAEHVDLAIVGAGAAGLMAAIWAGRTNPSQRILAIDGARTLGAKILVAGGGRCNVTHHHVDERDFCGSTSPAIRNVLRRFDVPRTIAFFAELGVELKREETGKLFPVTDDAHTVLDALLRAARDTGVEIRHPWRAERIMRNGPGFRIESPSGELTARRLILATGGKALPKSGSDGHGYSMVLTLGHSLTPRIFPALVPLILDPACFLRGLSGIALPATLHVRRSTGALVTQTTGSVLCTHFGLSGPAVLDISRHYLDLRTEDPGAMLTAAWLPADSEEQIHQHLQLLGSATLLRWLRDRLPERFARALLDDLHLDPATVGAQLTREQRRALVTALAAMKLPITGDRGFTFAEVTAGGVPLREVHLQTMESRVCPGLHLCGEICDVDGRIGGFNFQWAWASGFVAGSAAAQA